MRKMTLQEIQKVNLELMKDIHAFCSKNNIHYSLAYGSLIGAVRHKGFIPWDDDIDIMMPRPDFDRFSREYKSERGYRLSSVYDNDTYINYTRVYDTNTLVICPAKAATFDIGIWIDIYPIDGISDDENISNNQFQRLRHYTGIVMLWRKHLYNMSKQEFKAKARTFLSMIKLMVVNVGWVGLWHKRICSICTEIPFGETERCSSLVCMEANRDNRQEVFRTEDFNEFHLTSFEDQKFYIASGYDHILMTIFGDYMTLPPLEKRVSHIIHLWEFYSKK